MARSITVTMLSAPIRMTCARVGECHVGHGGEEGYSGKMMLGQSCIVTMPHVTHAHTHKAYFGVPYTTLLAPQDSPPYPTLPYPTLPYP